ncbi:MAG: cation:proton antiporter [Acidiferrobacter sp.]
MHTSDSAARLTAHPELVLFFVLMQLVVIVLAGRFGSTMAVRVGQVAAVGEIIVGILLGPSFMGLLAPGLFHYVFHSISSQPLTILSQIGLVFLMFQIGLEFDFTHLKSWQNRRAVVLVAAGSLCVPFLLGLTLGWYTATTLSPLASPGISALFIGTAFAITALPILGRILIDFHMTRYRVGVIAISAAAINDVIGWLALALVTALARGRVDASAFVGRIGLVLLFMLGMMTLVRPMFAALIRRWQTADNALPPTLLGILLGAMFLSGMATSALGIFAIFGGFMMGVILHGETDLVHAWRNQVSPFVLVFFLPIFFTYTGLRTDIGGLDTPALWGWCLLLLTLAMGGKYVGAYVAARMAGMDIYEGRVMGVLMNTRALMELIVINVGYDVRAISRNVFTMLVIMSVVSTVITAPYLRRLLPHIRNQKVGDLRES